MERAIAPRAAMVRRDVAHDREVDAPAVITHTVEKMLRAVAASIFFTVWVRAQDAPPRPLRPAAG
jgi:hypothetical protein